MNSTPTIKNMIEFSWAKSREILFPFNLKRWLKVLIIVSFAGAGIQGISANFNAPARSFNASSTSRKVVTPKIPAAMSSQITKTISPGSSAETPPFAGAPGPSTEQAQTGPEQGMGTSSVSQDAEQIEKLRTAMGRPKPKAKPALVVLVAGGVIFLGLVLAAFFTWLSSRFNFVLLDTIVTRESAIKEPFRKHKEAGNSYFLWSLALMGISLGAFLLGGLIIVLSVGITKWIPVIGIPLIILGSLLVFAVVVTAIFAGIVMRDFVLPVMYCEKISAMNAMNKFLEADTFAFGKVLQYLLVAFGLWIVAAIAQSIVAILVGIGGLIMGGIMAIPGIILIKVLPFLKLPLIIFGGLGVVALILAVIVVVGMVMLPVAIFFRAFALAYLTRLYPECDLLEFMSEKP